MIQITKLLSNQFAALATGSKNNPFTKARVQLAILYTIVFGSLVVTLSGILYYLFAADIHEDMSRVFPKKSEQVRIIDYHKGKLLNLMIVINGGILIFISGASYYLAGRTLKPIQDNYEAQKRFIADASHDLRTPIAVLKADIEVSLQDKTFPTSMKKTFISYLEEVNQMKLIVEDLLMLFRFDSHQIVLNKDRVDLNKLLSSSTSSLHSYAKGKSVTIALDLESKQLVSGDTLLLQQAYRNLLKNAIEYSDIPGVVSIKMVKQGQNVKIDVNNKGIGIATDKLDQVFERFYRTDGAKDSRKEGTGLGLPIAKEIVQKHLGSITISSSKQSGTTVSMLLPRLV